MNRREFMQQLELLLMDVPVEDRIDALQYYEDYFEDAGYEKEQDVILELQSPQAVAQIIKRDLGIKPEQQMTQNRENQSGFHDYRTEYERQNSQQTTGENSNQSDQRQGTHVSQIDHKLWLILFIVTLPITGGPICGAIATIFGLTVAAFAVTFAMIVSGGATMVGGIIILCTGLIAKGILILGIGMILLAVGLPGILLCSLICRVILPAIIKGIGKLFRFLFRGEAMTV